MLNTAKTIVLASGFWRLKAPRWHSGDLWVSDPRAGMVYRIDLDGKVTVVAEVPSRPFGLGFLPDGDLLVASMTQRLILNLGGEKAKVHADLADAAVGYLRDMTVARDGNALRDFFRRRRGGSGLLRVGPDPSGDAGRRGPIRC
jgi:sugar lactone lactonase YvrE